MREKLSVPLPFEVYSTILGLYRIPYLKYVNFPHQVSSFLKHFAHPPFETLIANALGMQTLDSAAGNLDRPHIRLIPLLSYTFFCKTKALCKSVTKCKGQSLRGQEQKLRVQRTNLKIPARRRKQGQRRSPSRHRARHSRRPANDHHRHGPRQASQDRRQNP